jgi:hypothetical protein
MEGTLGIRFLILRGREITGILFCGTKIEGTL